MRAILSRFLNSAMMARWTQVYADWRFSQKNVEVPACDENGIPFPSAYLMARVAGDISWRQFQRSGHQTIHLFRDLSLAHGGDISRAQRILDFGCGCGRLARHVPQVSRADFYGCDFNRQLVRWCRANLPGTYDVNQLKPPLRYEAQFFDIIYLFSVFTHLREATQSAWLAEFHRVLKPGGFLLITFHDEVHPMLDEIGVSTDALRRTQFHVHNDRAEGSNYLAAFQTREHFSRQASKWFDVCEIKSSRDTGVNQAVAVLRKPELPHELGG
ncbi:MAG: class I SAM-dependent methyltransferase [Henriciella sp.]